ncbi:MAG: UDP-glucose/GDP-mannose dehydrogenase family protein, partial [Rickettsiaceae bacterium]|nr:UDP-glucose/GDP-mannose dehydrogenase family protein [Rickettsiaceae bacterium]
MKIGFIGAGYVGLISGIMSASIGREVVCIDRDRSKIEALKNKECVIFEKDLDIYLSKTLDENMISFSYDYSDLKSCRAVFVCVGTPSREDGSADLSYVFESLEELARNITKDCLVVIKSTVPPGSCKIFQKFLKDLGFDNKIASNPEFLREGSAISDFLNGDRIVAGGDKESTELLRRIYQPLIEKGTIFLATDTTTSEMIKYCSNSFLAIKLSFINEMSNLCEEMGGDIQTLSKGMGLDQRIGSMFLKVGPGYGGSCFPKDTLALSHLAKTVNVRCDVLDAAIDSNLRRYELMRDKIKSICGTKRNLSIFGLAFKAGTDDVRESPAVRIIELLIEEGFHLKIYDPVAGKNFSKLGISDAIFCDNIQEACKESDGIVILTEWPIFANLDFAELASVMNSRILIDLRIISDVDLAKKSGFKVYMVGSKAE